MSRYFIIIFLIAIPFEIFAFDNNDVQIWSSTAIEKNQNNVSFYINEEVKWGGKMSHFYLHRTDCGVTFDVNTTFSVSLNYKQVNIQIGENWLAYNVPYSNLSFSTKIGCFEIGSRNRFEYWSAGEIVDFWRYRSRLKIEPLMIESVLPISAYIAEEVFIDFNSDRLKTLRTYIGMDYDLIEGIGLGLFYCLHQSDGGENWKNYQVIGSTIKFEY